MVNAECLTLLALCVKHSALSVQLIQLLMQDRRHFLKAAVLGAAAFSLDGMKPTAAQTAGKAVKGKPIVISTWDFGLPANKAAWEVLKKGGRALDAVEAGVKIPEILICF